MSNSFANTFRKTALAGLVGLSALANSGCASFFNHEQYSIDIRAQEDTSWTGYKTSRMTRQREKFIEGTGNATVTLQKAGCPDYEFVSSRGLSEKVLCQAHWAFYATMALTFPIWFITWPVDVATGGAARYEPQTINFRGYSQKALQEHLDKSPPKNDIFIGTRWDKIKIPEE